jgi:type 1 fimbria pilin
MIPCATQASVKCNVALPIVTFAIPSVLESAQNPAAGQFLTPWLDSPEVQTHNNCVFSDTSQAGAAAKGSGVYFQSLVDGGTTYEIFYSPAPGIGYIFKGKDRNGSYTPIKRDFSSFIHGYSPYYDTRFSVRLVSTGQPIVPGQIPAFQAGEFRVTEGQNFSAPSLLFMPRISVLAETCSVTNGSVAFELPRIRTKDLPNVGSVAGNTMRTIQINCQSELDVHMVLSDVTTPGNRSSTLTLTPESTASGVGIEIQHNGQRVSFGPDSSNVGTENQFLAGSKVLGAASIPLTARYIRTSSSLREGTVRGLATFTLSYQ